MHVVSLLILPIIFVSGYEQVSTQDKLSTYHVFGVHGTIRSQNYPNQYPVNTKRKWIIEIPKTFNAIEFHLEQFKTENPKWTKICFLSYLDIFHFPNNRKQRKLRLCGTKTGKIFIVNGNRANLLFRSSKDITDGKFLIGWRAVKACGGKQDNNGVIEIQESGVIEKNFFCEWKLLSNSEAIKINIKDFKVTGNNNCESSKILLMDSSGNVLEKICSREQSIIIHQKSVRFFVFISRRTSETILRATWRSIQTTNEISKDFMKCGFVKKKRRFKRIVGGSDKQQWPWVVQIRTSSINSDFTIRTSTCGGVIISPDYIVTAAHCLVKNNYVIQHKVLVHSNTVLPTDTKWIVIKPDSIMIHENYRHFPPKAPLNDIAIIRLPNKLHFDENIRPICLYMEGNGITDESQCYFAGWGRTLSRSRDPFTLHSVAATSRGHCSGKDSILCVIYGDGTGGACKGDSGSPLMCLGSDNRYYLRSILSYGSRNCPSYVDAHSDIGYYMEWIGKKTGIGLSVT